MTFSERIREAIAASGKTQSALAAEMGVSASAVAQYLSGNVKSMRAETAALFETATGYSATWIVTGKGPKVRYVPDESTIPAAGKVPMLSWTQAGQWYRLMHNFQPSDASEWLPCPVRHSEATFALRVEGLSMYNAGGDLSFKPPDVIFVDPQCEWSKTSLLVLRQAEGDGTTFRQLLVEGGTRYLCALNPSWPDRITPMIGNREVCGVVIAKLQSFI